MDMNRTIGANLRKLREANGLTQERLVGFLGIKRSAYANYETGDREAPIEVLEKVADLFGCELSELFEADLDAMLMCAFRVDDLSENDLGEIAKFKKIVKNYMKMNRLLEE